MKKKLFLLSTIFIIGKSIFAQKYFKIQGTKKVFTFYGKKASNKINDSTVVFYYSKDNIFYIAIKSLNSTLRPYVPYDILKKKEKTKVTSLGRGSDEITRIRFIYVNLIRAKKANADSQFIEEIIR